MSVANPEVRRGDTLNVAKKERGRTHSPVRGGSGKGWAINPMIDPDDPEVQAAGDIDKDFRNSLKEASKERRRSPSPLGRSENFESPPSDQLAAPTVPILLHMATLDMELPKISFESLPPPPDYARAIPPSPSPPSFPASTSPSQARVGPPPFPSVQPTPVSPPKVSPHMPTSLQTSVVSPPPPFHVPTVRKVSSPLRVDDAKSAEVTVNIKKPEPASSTRPQNMRPPGKNLLKDGFMDSPQTKPTPSPKPIQSKGRFAEVRSHPVVFLFGVLLVGVVVGIIVLSTT